MIFMSETVAKKEVEPKVTFGLDGSKLVEREIKGEDKGKLCLEVKNGRNRVFWERNPQYSFVYDVREGIGSARVMFSPTMLRTLATDNKEIGAVYKDMGAFISAAEELGSSMGDGEEKKTIKGKGFAENNQPMIFVKKYGGKITEFGLVGSWFSFGPSNEGGLKYPSLIVSPENIAKLSESKPGVVASMVYNTTFEKYADKIREMEKR